MAVNWQSDQDSIHEYHSVVKYEEYHNEETIVQHRIYKLKPRVNSKE